MLPEIKIITMSKKGIKNQQVAGVVFTPNVKTLLFAGEDVVIFRHESGEIEITQYEWSSMRKWTTIIDRRS